ncbi:hypothetical protein L209DRAFT_540440 [Thermothelomyces heterothallicus CBS 203.75]
MRLQNKKSMVLVLNGGKCIRQSERFREKKNRQEGQGCHVRFGSLSMTYREREHQGKLMPPAGKPGPPWMLRVNGRFLTWFLVTVTVCSRCGEKEEGLTSAAKNAADVPWSIQGLQSG